MKEIFSSTDSALGILWISVFKEKFTISVFHIFTPESDRRLKVFVQPYIEKISIAEKISAYLGQIIRQGHFGQKQGFRQKLRFEA